MNFSCLECGADVHPLHELELPREVDLIALAVGVLEPAHLHGEPVGAVHEGRLHPVLVVHAAAGVMQKGGLVAPEVRQAQVQAYRHVGQLA